MKNDTPKRAPRPKRSLFSFAKKRVFDCLTATQRGFEIGQEHPGDNCLLFKYGESDRSQNHTLRILLSEFNGVFEMTVYHYQDSNIALGKAAVYTSQSEINKRLALEFPEMRREVAK